MRFAVTFGAGVAAGAVIAGTAVWSRLTTRERTVREFEFDQGHAVGWIDGREHGRAERPAAVRALDSAWASGREYERARAHHPSTFAERN